MQESMSQDPLDARRVELRDRLASLDRELDALRALRADAADDDEHDPDGVPLSEEWSRLAGLRTAVVASLEAVDTAEHRRAAGAAATCISCGAPIDSRRLAVRPEATTCVTCAA